MSDVRLQALSKELLGLLERVTGTWSCNYQTYNAPKFPTSARAGVSVAEGQIEAWIFSKDLRQRAVLKCEDDVQPANNDLVLIRKIISVFNYDLTTIGDEKKSDEIWSALSQTRFLRAASRMSNISTHSLLRRVRIFEAAARQTYEGSPFVGSVVMPHAIDTFRDHAGERYRPFNKSMSFDQALLREKWLKPFLEEGDFALVALNRKVSAVGFTDASSPWPFLVLSAPTTRLEGLYGYLKPGISVLSASPSRDIHLILSSGVTFLNSKGYWRYQNWSPLHNTLTRHCEDDTATNLMRLIKSSSYLHRGALYVVLPDHVDTSNVIPDHRSDERASDTLRSTVKGLNLSDNLAVKLLSVASQIDGAVILNRHGDILDVASMVSKPSPRALKLAKQKELKIFPGARSTAAWNASIHGIAIKISDDGPVDVYECGQHIFHSE